MTPAPGTGDAAAMARGEPGLPQRFTWRGREYRVADLIRKWKSSSPCRHGSGEMYLRRHWYQVLSEPFSTVATRGLPTLMTIYCDRQAKNRKHLKSRWWVYSIQPAS